MGVSEFPMNEVLSRERFSRRVSRAEKATQITFLGFRVRYLGVEEKNSWKLYDGRKMLKLLGTFGKLRKYIFAKFSKFLPETLYVQFLFSKK